jgi:hypothetical protein
LVSYAILVFCRSAAPLTRQRIAEEIVDGVFFDDTPQFDPELGSPEARALVWDALVITYSDAKRPVIVERQGALKGIEEELEGDFGSGQLDPALRRRLVEAAEVISVDINPATISDEAWEMCDFIERLIAQTCDGLIYAPGDGIFDARLQPVAKATARS